MKVPLLMGIVNVTPDSFSDGGRLGQAAVDHGLKLLEEGADILDIGGESTRPGAIEVSEAEEQRRVMPVMEKLLQAGARLSVDTRRASTAALAIQAGVRLINDVRAGQDPGMFPLIARSGAEIILMHSRGTPATMQSLAVYKDVVSEIWNELAERQRAAEACGISPEKILLDPGLGFAKSTTHNLMLLKSLSAHTCSARIVIGASRKRFIGELTAEPNPSARLEGSLAVAIFAARAGASILRVHDIAATRRTLLVWSELE
jgi:dihydropteroate synthase